LKFQIYAKTKYKLSKQNDYLMNIFRTLPAAIAILILPYFMISCSDSDMVNSTKASEFSVQNLPRLNQDINGIYEAWVSVESSLDHGDDAYRTIGRFNISSDGRIVDKDGNAFSLNLSRIPDISAIEDAIISIEPPGDNDTVLSISSTRILGGVKVNQSGKYHFALRMDYPEVLGTAASGLTSATAKYMLAAPTTGDTVEYKKGVWYSLDTSGEIPGLTLATIADSLDWIYQAWVYDTVNHLYYNEGRFSASNLPDDYYQCQVSYFAQWDLPGQEWTLPNCPQGLPAITDLSSGSYKLYVTLEPRHESGPNLGLPFNFVIFSGNIPNNVNYGDVMQLANGMVMPGGEMILSLEQVR
jgi:hypothetical protein